MDVSNSDEGGRLEKQIAKALQECSFTKQFPESFSKPGSLFETGSLKLKNAEV
jgi:hypothetical protein